VTARPEQAGTVVLREGIVVYVSEAAAALSDRAPGDIVGRPFTEFVVPEQRDEMQLRHQRRLRGEPVDPAVELALALPGGGRRVVEAHAERDGRDVLVHLRDLTLRDARRLRLEAVASLGAALQRELTDDAIHARVAAGLARLGLHSALIRVERDGVRIVWASGPPELQARFLTITGRPLDGYLGLPNVFSATVAREGYAFSDDWGRDAAGIVPDGVADALRGAVDSVVPTQAIGVRLDQRDDASRALVVAGDWLRADDAPAVRLFASQVAAALDAARTIANLSRRNAQLTLLVEVARASSHLDPALLLEGALRRMSETLGADLALAYLRDGERLVLASATGAIDADAARAISDLGGGDGAPELALRRLAPVRTTVGAAFGGRCTAIGRCAESAEVIAVPLVAKSEGIGAILLARAAPPAFGEADAALLSSVGVQLGVAVDAARLFVDVRQRLADLEAVHALAVRVHANAPGDVGTLLQDGCRDIARALAARAAAIHLVSDDRTALRAVASSGLPRVALETPIDLARDAFSAEVVRAGVPGVSDDVTRDPRTGFHGRTDVPPLAMLAVPLVSRAEVRGVVYVADAPGRRFSAGDVALANALAGTLGVGVENAELYADARRRVEELFVLNEVGRAVAGSLDLAEVLREAAEGARRIARTTRGFVILYDARAGEMTFGAGAGLDEDALRDFGGPLPPGSVIERVLRELRPEAVEDVERSTASDLYRSRIAGRALVAVPVVLRGEPLGVLVADEDRGPRRFTESDVERLTAVADRLAVAIENARLYLETRRRAEELGLLHEVGRSLVETLDIEQVLRAGVRNLARIVDAPDAYLMLATEDGARLEVRAVTGSGAGRAGTLHLPLVPPGQSLAARVFASREPLVVEDALIDPRVQPVLRDQTGARAQLALPLVVRDRAIGAVVIVETRGPRLFTPAEVERAAAIANQLAVAAENARLYEDLRRSYAQLARAQQQLIHRERLAALGELSAVVAHEVRNPLGVIFNSLGSLRRLVRPGGDAKMLFDIVEEEADRLNRIVGDLLDFARPSTPQVRPELLDRVVEDAVVSAVGTGSPIELARELDPSVPPVAMDARLVRQAVLNVAVNAVQAMPRGGRITIRTRRDGDDAVLEIEDTGVGIPEEVRERIFEPFFTTKASGTGLGLAVVKRIVEGHGGAVAVRSTPGTGTVFALRFPIHGPVENDPPIG
jgi:PAS domain S-box-containing protein